MADPRYQEVKSAQIPSVTDDDGTAVRIVSGSFWGKEGPIAGVAADPGLPRRLPLRRHEESLAC